eukprot:m.308398 g.308398  ORF g.308398 m.308398 type:complete len:292 (+) comp43932_c0_seq1:54-929(+)
MSESVGQRFQRMLERICMTSAERSHAIQRHTEMRTSLLQQPWVTTLFLTGSYSRNTALNPLHDVDMFCVMDGISPDNPRYLIQLVQKAIKQAFPYATVDLQKHSAGVKFPGESITYDVIPAVRSGSMYLIPERGEKKEQPGEMIISNPGAVDEELERRHRESGNRLIPLIRLMKKWNELNHKKIKNFHMEVLSYGAAPGLASKAWPKESCQYLFKYLSENVQRDCYVPGVESSRGNAKQINLRETRSASQLANFAGELATAARKAQRAIDLERSDSHSAHRLWEDIFPSIY